ncbi:MAG: GGDEF domain-containing protein [Pseudomonadota bacterium]
MHTTPIDMPAVRPWTGGSLPVSIERFFNLSMDLLCIADSEGRLHRANPAFEQVLGWPLSRLLADSFFEFVHPEDRPATQNIVRTLAKGAPVTSFEHRLLCRQGGHRVIRWTAHPDPVNEVFHAVGRDSTDRRRSEDRLTQHARKLESANRRLARAANSDDLTGLMNRRALLDRFSVEAARRQSLSLLLVDLDHFKAVNDRHGHPLGDQVLTQVGRLLEGVIRPADCAARLGGEEFAVLLPNTTAASATVVAERVLRAFRQTGWPRDPITASIGVATVLCQHGASAHRLWSRLNDAADHALYRAKRAGRNRVIRSAEHILGSAQP